MRSIYELALLSGEGESVHSIAMSSIYELALLSGEGESVHSIAMWSIYELALRKQSSFNLKGIDH